MLPNLTQGLSQNRCQAPYYRCVLTGYESKMWHHCNPDMATWRRKVIIEETGVAADAAGYDAFAIFDVDVASFPSRDLGI